MCTVLDFLVELKGKPEVIIQGGAEGADTMAKRWAKSRGITIEEYNISRDEWEKYGSAAGPRRNGRMIVHGKPDLVIAFPKNGNLEASKGTRNMVHQARAAGIRTIVVGEDC